MRCVRIALAVLGSLLLGAVGACTTSNGSGSEVRVSSTTSATMPSTSVIAGKLRPPTADLQIRAVRGMFAATHGQTCDAVDQPTGSDTVVVPSADLAGTNETLCYQLGPVAGDASDIAAARADGSSGVWEVAVTATPGASVKRLNSFFNDCYRGTGTCPSTDGGAARMSGAVAVVLDGKVLTAPTIRGEDLASVEFVVSGSLTKAQATKLAKALNRVGG